MKIEQHSTVVVLHQPSEVTAKKLTNGLVLSRGSAGLNAQSSFPKTVKHLLSLQWAFPICKPHIFSFTLFSLFFYQPFSHLLCIPCKHTVPSVSALFLSFCLNFLENCCPLADILDFVHPHLFLPPTLFPSPPPSLSGGSGYSS